MNDGDRKAIRDNAFKGAFWAVMAAWIVQAIIVIFAMLLVLSDY